uniref:Uncharacterized protein n=1 Tax=Oryza sativa subsp. japonica TaxID=39947 RepID=Q6K288_ORYSJ|nr:hypothetical protein [Oryza sativa Japonica Group]
MCPFKNVYGFKPTSPIDLLPLPLQERTNMDASKRAAYVKKIHEKTKEEIEKKWSTNWEILFGFIYVRNDFQKDANQN